MKRLVCYNTNNLLTHHLLLHELFSNPAHRSFLLF